MPGQGSTTNRGYGSRHQVLRKRWATTVHAGRATCCICHKPIAPDADWHLDHTPDRISYRGVAHAKCNLEDGGRRGAAVTNAARSRSEQPPPARWDL